MNGLFVVSTSIGERRRRIVAAALRAAYAYTVRATRTEAVPELCRMTGVVMEALGPGRGPVAPMELADLLHGPLNDLLTHLAPGDVEVGAVRLLDGDRLTESAISLAAEYVVPLDPEPSRAEWLPTWTRMRAEEIEKATFAALIAKGSEEDYSRSRRFLVEHPAGFREQIATEASGRAVAQAGSYAPVPDDQVHQTGDGRGWWWRCPLCRWPMHVIGLRVRCWYAPHTPVFEIQPQVRRSGKPWLLRVDEGAPRVAVPSPLTTEGAACVDAGVWRRIVVPGATELRIVRELSPLVDRISLWPEHDAYDLDIQTAGQQFRLEVKECWSVRELIDRLQRHPPPPGVRILLPRGLEHQKHLLEDLVPGLRVLTEAQLRATVRRARERAS